jgi:serine/threonine-protein kinase
MTLDRRRVTDALPNYEVGAEIGRGGWAVVLHARHRILEREVAVKHLPVAFGADPVVRDRFVAEARLVARLDHPHIVPVYDFVESNGTYLIVMEYLPGGSLWDRFQRDGIRPDEACAYVLVACSALDHAHEHGAIHRDIKPENLLLDDRPGVVKLGDFGVAKALGAAAHQFTSVGQVVGTPAYLAPEQILGEPATPATDVYACATMLYELLTGELPFPADGPIGDQLLAKVSGPARPITDMLASVPDAIARVVMRDLALDPKERHATVLELGEALAEAATASFGPGWLRSSGVRLDGSPHLLAITEREPRAGRSQVADISDRVRGTTVHHRLGELMAQARDSLPSPPRPADVPASWYADPFGRAEQRYWDGAAWTHHVANRGAVGIDPVP